MSTVVDGQPSAPEAARTTAPRPPWWSRALEHASLPYLVSAAFTLLVALWTYRPWAFKGAIASPHGDALAFHAWVQATIEDGWYENASRLSAPFAQNSHTYTVTDEFLFAFIGKVLGPLTGSAGAAVTWYVVLCFPVAALFAVGAARYLRIGRLAALVPGILFPLLPDHFLRAGGHFSLSSTWAISLGMIVALSLVVAPRATGRRRTWFQVAMLVSCLVIGLTNAYYATFIAMIVAVAAVGGAMAARSWRILWTGLARCAVLIGSVVVAMVVDAIYSPDPYGYSSFEITRSQADAEIYGGKIFAMLLPAAAHRFEAFRALRNSYDATFPNPAETPALGLVSAVGFVALVVWAILLFFRRRPDVADSRLRILAGLLWMSLLAYSVGGLGSIWSFLLDGGGIRVWSRMHVVIGLIVLLAIAITLDRLRKRWWRAAAVGLVLVVGVVDQTTPLARPDPVSALALRDDVTSFTSQVEDRAGDDAMVFQLPQVNFPVPQFDPSPATIYDGFLPYLYSTDSRWSFGGLEGDPTVDWQQWLTARPFEQQVPLLRAAGFSGISLDTAALTTQPLLRDQVRAVLGEPTFTSDSGRWEYYELSDDVLASCPAGVVDEMGDLAVRPPMLYPGDGIDVLPGVRSNDEGDAQLRIVTLREGGWDDVSTSFSVGTADVRLEITFPDGSTQTVEPNTTETITWSGPVSEAETPIDIRRLDGTGVYGLGGLVATAVPSAAVAECQPALVAVPEDEAALVPAG
ncbi:hypothetical protein [Oerskovia gallyi]|uniref:DUF6311 domain-containing protein n=1 Tax=Oerskovia gallyi TaxID=2762226 RepID=A0ABR8V545_9CELL|nr:hypothetical protein [Oerskovia gallyi]MBD7999892.1 hypothetical protein [Oerskovia gallyi]